MSSEDDAHFTELLSGYLDASLNPEQEAQLLEFLQQPSCQERFVELTRLQSEIAGLLAAPIEDDTMAALVLQDIAKGPAEVTAAGLLIPHRGESSLPTRSTCGPRFRFGLVLRKCLLGGIAAAILMTVALLWMRSSWFPPPPIVAHVARTRAKVFVFGSDGLWRPAPSGREVRAGEGIVTVGEGSGASVEYADGTVLELGANTTLAQLTDAPDGRGRDEPAKRVILTQGTLEVRAVEQPEGHPMVVLTPHAEVVVRGTAFALESENDATALSVRHGMVHFTRLDTNRSIEVSAGRCAVAEPGAERFAARPSPDPPDTVAIDLTRSLRLGHKGGWYALAFAPDSTAVAGGMLEEGVMRWWPLVGDRAKTPLTFSKFTKALWSAAIAPDGRTLAAGGVEKAVCVWDVATRQVLAVLPHKDDVRAVAFSPDGRTLASGGHDSAVRLWEPRTGTARAVFHENDRDDVWAGVYSLAFSADGRRLAVGRSDRRVRVHSLPSGEVLGTLVGHTDFVYSVAFSPRGGLLVTASKNEVIVRDAVTYAERYRLAASAPVAFTPDGNLLATGGLASPALWDAATGRKRARFRGHYGEIYALAFSPDGRWLAIGDWISVTLLRNTELEEQSWGGP